MTSIFLLVAIRKEIQDIENGKFDIENNPIKMSPHTQRQVINTQWNRPYSRELAAFPVVIKHFHPIFIQNIYFLLLFFSHSQEFQKYGQV